MAREHGREAFEASLGALTNPVWTQTEMDQLRYTLFEWLGLGPIHNNAKVIFESSMSRWFGGVQQKWSDTITNNPGYEVPNPTDLGGVNFLTDPKMQAIASYAVTVHGLGTQSHYDNIVALVGSPNLLPEDVRTIQRENIPEV